MPMSVSCVSRYNVTGPSTSCMSIDPGFEDGAIVGSYGRLLGSIQPRNRSPELQTLMSLIWDVAQQWMMYMMRTRG